MTRSKRLQPVQRISEAREKDAARELGECQQRLEKLKQQLDELERYRDEYRLQYQQRGRAGFSAQKLLQLQQFLASIDQGIAQQQQAISVASLTCEEKKQHWNKARGRSQALDKVAARYLEDERLQQNRREQKENDEYAQRKAVMLRK